MKKLRTVVATWDECGQIVQTCNFTLLNKEKKLNLADYYGKAIVDFSTSVAGACINIAAEGDKLVAKYGEKIVIWLTVLIENEYGLLPTQEI